MHVLRRRWLKTCLRAGNCSANGGCSAQSRMWQWHLPCSMLDCMFHTCGTIPGTIPELFEVSLNALTSELSVRRSDRSAHQRRFHRNWINRRRR